MSPDAYRLGSSSSTLKNRQRGFLIPLAIFIVVVMSFFAIALWRTTVQTSLSSAQELVSVQAFYAAESGAQFAMNQLFDPIQTVSRNNADAACVAMTDFTTGPDFKGVAGLNNCMVQVRCECHDCGAGHHVSYYSLTSQGNCGTGRVSAIRQIRVSSFVVEGE